MDIENYLSAFADKANLLIGGVIAALSYIFGGNWHIFVLFLALNIVDYFYGVAKANATGTRSSAKGAKGILKKVSYWVIIAIAFGISVIFIDIGNVIGVDLSFMQLIGWFTLAVYIVNELTSIVENMVALGVNVPDILIRGLAVMKTAVDEAGDKIIPDKSGTTDVTDPQG